MGPFRSTKGASKQRRDLINSEISHIRTLLPLSESALQRLSQLQVMSLACSYIRKCRHFALDHPVPPTSSDGQQEASLDGSNLLPFDFHKALMGFLMIVSREGRLLYISDNVTQHLGHSMADLMTQSESLYELVDKSDHSRVRAGLVAGAVNTDGLSLVVRMNISRSRAKQAGASRDSKIVSMRGHFIQPVAGMCGEGGEGEKEQPVFTAICSPLIITETNDALADDHPTAFKSVHKLDMSFIDINRRGEGHLGYKSAELRSVSWYQLIHPDDSQQACETHRRAIQSGQETGCTLVVRLLSKAGRWVWLASVLLVRQSAVDAQETVIVCCHQVIDEEEAKQLKAILAQADVTLSPQPLPTLRDPFQSSYQHGGSSADYSPTGTEDTGDGFSPSVTIEGTFSVWDANYGPLPPLSGLFNTSPSSSSIAGYGHPLPPSYNAAVAPTDTWKESSSFQLQQQETVQGGQSVVNTSSPTVSKPSLKRKAGRRGPQGRRPSSGGIYYHGGHEEEPIADTGVDESEESVDFKRSSPAYTAGGELSNGGGGVTVAVAPPIVPGHSLSLKNKVNMQPSSAAATVAAYTANSPYTYYPPTPEMYVNDVMVGSPTLHVSTRHAASDGLVPQAPLTPVEPEGSTDTNHPLETLTPPNAVPGVNCSSEEWLAEIVNYLKAEEEETAEQEEDSAASATHPPEYESAVIGANANWIDAFVSSGAFENGWRNLGESVVDPSVLLGENL